MSTDLSTIDFVPELAVRIKDPVLAFRSDEDVNALVEYVRETAIEAAKQHTPTTSAGRKAIVSVSAKVSRSRAFLKDQAKIAQDSLKAELDAVKARSESVYQTLADLRDEIRQPVTIWEEAEAARVKFHQDNLTRIRSLTAQVFRMNTEAEIESAQKAVFDLGELSYDEFETEARAAFDAFDAAVLQATADLAAKRAAAEAAAKAQAELAAERAEAQRLAAQAEKDRQEAKEAHEALAAANMLSAIAEKAPVADRVWLVSQNEIVRGFANHPHASVRLSARIAIRSITEALETFKQPVAPVESIVESGPPWAEEGVQAGGFMGGGLPTPVVVNVAPTPAVKSSVSDRDILLNLVTLGDALVEFLRDFWSENHGEEGEPIELTEFATALNEAEEHLK